MARRPQIPFPALALEARHVLLDKVPPVQGSKLLLPLPGLLPVLVRVRDPDVMCWSCQSKARAQRTLGEPITVVCTHKKESPVIETVLVEAEAPLPTQAPLTEERKRAIIGGPPQRVPPERRATPPCAFCGKPTGSWRRTYCQKKCGQMARAMGNLVFPQLARRKSP